MYAGRDQSLVAKPAAIQHEGTSLIFNRAPGVFVCDKQRRQQYIGTKQEMGTSGQERQCINPCKCTTFMSRLGRKKCALSDAHFVHNFDDLGYEIIPTLCKSSQT